MGYDELREQQERRDDVAEVPERVLARRDRRDDHTPRCVKEGCNYPAPLGLYCGMHTGDELRSKRAGAEVRP
jgi:hypothetical protein